MLNLELHTLNGEPVLINWANVTRAYSSTADYPVQPCTRVCYSAMADKGPADWSNVQEDLETIILMLRAIGGKVQRTPRPLEPRS